MTTLLLTVIVSSMIALSDLMTLCDVFFEYSSCCIDSIQLAAATVLSAKSNKKKKDKPSALTQHQVDAVVGMAHGDAHIERRPKGSRLKICQGEKQMNLVFHLYSVFDGFVGAQPRNYVTTLADGRVRSE